MFSLRQAFSVDGSRVWAALGVVALWAILVLVVLNLSFLQIFGVVLATAAAVGMLVRPAAGFTLLVALRVWLDLLWFVEGSVFGLTLMETYGGVGTLGLAAMLALRLDDLGRHPAIRWLAVFLALTFLAFLRAGGDTAGLFARMVSPFMVMLAASVYLRDAASAQRYLVVFGAAALVPIARSVVSLVRGADYALLAGSWRLLGGYQNATNHALMMLVFGAVGVLALYLAKSNIQRVVAAVATAGALAATYESYNRSAVIGFILFATLFLWFEGRRRTLLTAVPALLLAIASSDVMSARFASLASYDAGFASSQDDIGSGRVGLWTSSMERFLSRPLYDQILGMGLGEQYIAFTNVEPHNDYLALTYQAGPIATFAAFFVILGGAIHGRRAARAATDPTTRAIANFSAALSFAVLPTSFVTNGFFVRPSAGWYAFAIAGIGYGLGIAADDRARKAAAALAKPIVRPTIAPFVEPTTTRGG